MAEETTPSILYHDLNGLLAAKKLGIPLTVILVNNDGGGIFSFLPQASEKTHFEDLFGTPTGPCRCAEQIFKVCLLRSLRQKGENPSSVIIDKNHSKRNTQLFGRQQAV